MKHLTAIAGNMYWSWNRSLRRLFEKIDPVAWNSVGENPIALLKSLDKSKISQLQNDVENSKGRFLMRMRLIDGVP